MTVVCENYPNHFININNQKHQCRAGGILPYTIVNNKLWFLLQKSGTKKKLYSDFGGKREEDDKNIMYTAAREFSEETNGIFYYNQIFKDTKNNIKKSTIITESLLNYTNPLFVYNFNGKYLIYLLRLYPIDIKNFDNIEYFTNMKRTCEWIDGTILKSDSFIYNELQYRLRKGLKRTINKLYDILYNNQDINF